MDQRLTLRRRFYGAGTRVLTLFLLTSTGIMAADMPALVKVRLRNQKTKYGQVLSYKNRSYRFQWVDNKIQSVPIQDIAFITYRPNVPDGFVDALKKRSVVQYRPMTEADALQLAIKQLRAERKAERRKHLEQAQGNVAQLGLDHIVGTITEDIQDNLLDMLASDRELQSIILDKDIQKTIDDGDIVSLMNNEKIVNLVRNKKKVKKMTDALLGKDDKEKKASRKKGDDGNENEETDKAEPTPGAEVK